MRNYNSVPYAPQSFTTEFPHDIASLWLGHMKHVGVSTGILATKLVHNCCSGSDPNSLIKLTWPRAWLFSKIELMAAMWTHARWNHERSIESLQNIYPVAVAIKMLLFNTITLFSGCKVANFFSMLSKQKSRKVYFTGYISQYLS